MLLVGVHAAPDPLSGEARSLSGRGTHLYSPLDEYRHDDALVRKGMRPLLRGAVVLRPVAGGTDVQSLSGSQLTAGRLRGRGRSYIALCPEVPTRDGLSAKSSSESLV